MINTQKAEQVFSETFKTAHESHDGYFRPDENEMIDVRTKNEIDLAIAAMRADGVAVLESGVDLIPTAWEYPEPKFEYASCIRQRGQSMPAVRVFTIKFPRSVWPFTALALQDNADGRTPRRVNLFFDGPFVRN